MSMIHPNRLSLSACIGGVAMPKESDGNVFALAGFDTVLRIYDIRCSNSSRKLPRYYNLYNIFLFFFIYRSISSNNQNGSYHWWLPAFSWFFASKFDSFGCFRLPWHSSDRLSQRSKQVKLFFCLIRIRNTFNYFIPYSVTTIIFFIFVQVRVFVSIW